MYVDWIYQVSELIKNSHDFFWGIYSDSTFYLKPVLLGVLSLLTQSQFIINFFLIFLFLYLFKKENWLNLLIYVCIGRTVGVFLGIGIATTFGDYSFHMILKTINFTYGLLILVILLFCFVSARKGITFKIKRWHSFFLGLSMSFYFDPVFYGVSKYLPFFFSSSVDSFVKPLLFSMTLVTPLILFGLVSFGFEFDKWINKRKYLTKVNQIVLYTFLVITAVYSFIPFWL